jgi:CRISPR system Cascade subunit CasD
MGIPILLLRLEGPLQSWGERARWDFRDSAVFPTKSGVMGLLACALGLSRNDAGIVDLNSAVRMAVRADRPGSLTTDFHTVQGHDGILLNAEGKKRSGGETIISHRQYLQDASFLVALSADKALLKRLESALDDPEWTYFLGRKSCPATRPVFEALTEEYASLAEAIAKAPPAERCCDCPLCEIEDEAGMFLRRDVTTDKPGRVFTTRRVLTGPVDRNETGAM